MRRRELDGIKFRNILANRRSLFLLNLHDPRRGQPIPPQKTQHTQNPNHDQPQTRPIPEVNQKPDRRDYILNILDKMQPPPTTPSDTQIIERRLARNPEEQARLDRQIEDYLTRRSQGLLTKEDRRFATRYGPEIEDAERSHKND